MRNIAEKTDSQGAWLGIGLIRARDHERYLVWTDFGAASAERAADCLLVPETGDRVLLVWDGREELYILSVLKRANPDSPAVLAPQGDADLQVQGRLNLLANEVLLGGLQNVSITTGNLNLSTSQAQAWLGRLDYRAGLISGKVQTLKTTAERIIERCRRYYRRTDEFEDVRAGRIRLWVKDLFKVKSKTTDIKSEDRVKVDADKILLG